jgi:hypothetical protein
MGRKFPPVLIFGILWEEIKLDSSQLPNNTDMNIGSQCSGQPLVFLHRARKILQIVCIAKQNLLLNYSFKNICVCSFCIILS